uniref:hypothetical protein n=1 Tax=Fulvivirga sp. TaxID=1931237 RepID=UPI00404B0DCB
MGFLKDNVIPGNHGKVFETDAKKDEDLAYIKSSILKIKGVEDVVIDRSIFPIEFTVYTSALVKVDDVEKVVQKSGFHAIPQELFSL